VRPAGCAHPFCDGTEKGAGSASRFDNSQFVKRTVRRITHQIEDEFDHPAASEDLSVFRCVIDIEPTRHARRGPCWLRWSGFARYRPRRYPARRASANAAGRRGTALISSLRCSTTPRAATTTAGVHRWSSGSASAHRRIEPRRHVGYRGIPVSPAATRRQATGPGGERGWRNSRLGRWPGPCLVRRTRPGKGSIGSVE
jgi:hypothetical protein